jgi:hypothetical protein
MDGRWIALLWIAAVGVLAAGYVFLANMGWWGSSPGQARAALVTVSARGFGTAAVTADSGNTDVNEDLHVAFVNKGSRTVTLYLQQDGGCRPDDSWTLDGPAARGNAGSAPKDAGCLTIRPGQEAVTLFAPAWDSWTVAIQGWPAARPLTIVPVSTWTVPHD